MHLCFFHWWKSECCAELKQKYFHDFWFRVRAENFPTSTQWKYWKYLTTSTVNIKKGFHLYKINIALERFQTCFLFAFSLYLLDAVNVFLFLENLFLLHLFNFINESAVFLLYACICFLLMFFGCIRPVVKKMKKCINERRLWMKNRCARERWEGRGSEMENSFMKISL